MIFLMSNFMATRDSIFQVVQTTDYYLYFGWLKYLNLIDNLAAIRKLNFTWKFVDFEISISLLLNYYYLKNEEGGVKKVGISS
jgi:hypothetical protein